PTRTLPHAGIVSIAWAIAMPDGKRILLCGYDAAGHGRLYAQEIAGGGPRLASPQDYVPPDGNVVSPHGKLAAALSTENGTAAIVPLDGGAPRPLPGVERLELPLRWSGDGKSVFVYPFGEVPARLYRVDPVSGARSLWKEISPADPT